MSVSQFPNRFQQEKANRLKKQKEKVGRHSKTFPGRVAIFALEAMASTIAVLCCRAIVEKWS